MDSGRAFRRILVPTLLVLLLAVGCGSDSATIPRGPSVAASGVVTAYTDLTAFENASPGPLTVVDFDTDPDGVVISAPDPGVLASAYYKAYEIFFLAGVILGDPGQPFFGTSAPNTIGDGDINTATPALVDVTFIIPADQVGIMNIGGEAELRVFDVAGALIGSVRSDASEETKDFVGLVSSVPIYRMEYDFVGGQSFGGDDLVFRGSQTALASAGEVTTTNTVGTTQTTTGVSLPAGPSGHSSSGGTPGPGPTTAPTTPTAPPAEPAAILVEETDPHLSWNGGEWWAQPFPSCSGGSAQGANSAGNSVTIAFTGTRITWLSITGDLYGVATVHLDGHAETVNLYEEGSSRWQAKVWSSGNLPYGYHKVRIECTGTGVEFEGNMYTTIYIDAFEVVGTLD